MATLDLNRLMDNLRVQLPGAIDNALRMEMFNVLNDFFQGSNIWREDIEFAVTAGVKSYMLVPSGPASIVRLMGVVDDKSIPVPAVFDLITTDLALRDTPSSDATCTAQVALTVNDPLDREGYPVFPMWVLNLYQNDIISGVLGRMMAQPAKPYSNLQLASVYTRSFQAAIAAARMEANRRYAYGAQAWRFPQGFSRRKAYR